MEGILRGARNQEAQGIKPSQGPGIFGTPIPEKKNKAGCNCSRGGGARTRLGVARRASLLDTQEAELDLSKLIYRCQRAG